MTDRNELERLLEAATEGPWEAEYDPINDGDHATAICIPGYAGQFGTFLAYCQHNWNDAVAGEHRISWKEATANAALICFLRNNAHHYLSLMDEVERLREERDFLLARSGHAGSCSFAPGRWTGVSSNALVTIAFGGDDDRLPSDTGDLAACYRTMLRLPRHLLSRRVWEQLEAGERYVASKYDISGAQDAAGWTEEARQALGEPK